jgi:UDP-N-acetylglucosamine 3-dehydrogenase
VLKIGTDPVDNVILELRDGTEERFQAGAISTNENQQTSGVIQAFVDSIEENRRPEISGEEGMKS